MEYSVEVKKMKRIMKLNKFVIITLALGLTLTGCKDKKVEANEVETAAVEAVEETETESEETEREEKNTIAVVGKVNLRDRETSTEEERELEETSEADETSKLEETSTEEESSTEEETIEKIDLRDSDTKESEREASINGTQYQNFIADMSKLADYKYVGYDGDSSVFLNINNSNETTSTLAIIYREVSEVENLEEQKKEIGASLVKELTGIDINIAQTDFRERECKSGKYLGLPFGDSELNISGYLAFRIKKDRLECIIDTIDSTEPEDRKLMKNDVLTLLENVEFNGNECEADYDIAFDNINVGIQKMKNGE